jgi:predicted transcriptional regulator
MPDIVHIPKTLAKRLERVATLSRCKPDAIVKSAIEERLEYEEWVLKEIEAGIAEADRGEVITHDELKQQLEKARAERAGKRKKAA